MGETTFTFRIDEQLKLDFADAAKQHDRTCAQLIRDFMRDYIKQTSQITVPNPVDQGYPEPGAQQNMA